MTSQRYQLLSATSPATCAYVDEYGTPCTDDAAHVLVVHEPGCTRRHPICMMHVHDLNRYSTAGALHLVDRRLSRAA